MIALDQDEEEVQPQPDPHIYQPEEQEEEQEDDDLEIDRRIRRSYERLRRLTIIGSPDFNSESLCEDTLTVEGGFDTGYAVNYVDCGKAAEGGVTPGACPSAITIEFHGVTLDCGCTPIISGDARSAIVTNLAFNDDPLPLTAFHACDPNCFLDSDYATPLIHTIFYGDTDCSGSPILEENDFLNQLSVEFVGGIWYVIAIAYNALIFYGTTTDITSPIANTLVCSTSPIVIDSPITDCIFGGPFTFTGSLAHGGTVSVTM